MSRWLVTGAGGMLGRDVVEVARAAGHDTVALDHEALDVGDREAVAAAVREARPEVIANCAAFTRVDDCEERADHARRINGDGVAHLAAAADEVGALLVQVSTDYVFDGKGTRPYREDDPVAPRSEYGRSKLAGEEAARAARQHLIVRTAWLYGPHGWNFVEAIRSQVAAGRSELKVVDDQVGSPTYTPDLAAAIVALVESEGRGVVHFTNGGSVSWFGYCQELVRRFGWAVQVWPISSDMVGRPAPRPAYSVLDSGRYRELTGREPRPWQEALTDYLAERRSEES